jgi:hypothetical protein
VHQTLKALTSDANLSSLMARAKEAGHIATTGILQVGTTGRKILALKEISQKAQDSGSDLLRAATALWENRDKNAPLIERAISRSLDEWEKRDVAKSELPELAAVVLITDKIALKHDVDYTKLGLRALTLAGKIEAGPLGEEYLRIKTAYDQVIQTIYPT